MSVKYNIKVIVDKNKDLQNWLQAAHNASSLDKIKLYLGPEDSRFLDQIVNTNHTHQRALTKNKLNQIYHELNDLSDQCARLQYLYDKCAPRVFSFIENITQKPLFYSTYQIFLTTIPFCTYSTAQSVIRLYYKIDTPLLVLAHEILHFQTQKYWREKTDSCLHKVTEQQYQYIKELLTVVIDDEAQNIVEAIDHGYPGHQKKRNQLYKYWQQHHDFGQLVEDACRLVAS